MKVTCSQGGKEEEKEEKEDKEKKDKQQVRLRQHSNGLLSWNEFTKPTTISSRLLTCQRGVGGQLNVFGLK